MIHLRDRDLGNSGWESTLRNCFGDLFLSAEVDTAPISGEGPTYIVFLHSQSKETVDSWLGDAKSGRLFHLIIGNSQGGTTPTEGQEYPGNVSFCYWNPRQFADLPRPKKLVSQIKGMCRDKVAPDWNLLRPAPQDTIMAARLIREAANYCETEASFSLHGIRIHRPPSDVLIHARRAAADFEAGKDVSSAISSFEAEIQKLNPE